MRKLQAEAKILLGLAQVLMLCDSTFQVSIPAPFSTLASYFRFLTLNFLDLVNLQCLRGYDWSHVFTVSCLTPPALVCLVRAVGWRFAGRESKTEQLRQAFDEADTDDSGTL